MSRLRVDSVCFSILFNHINIKQPRKTAITQATTGESAPARIYLSLYIRVAGTENNGSSLNYRPIRTSSDVHIMLLTGNEGRNWDIMSWGWNEVREMDGEDVRRRRADYRGCCVDREEVRSRISNLILNAAFNKTIITLSDGQRSEYHCWILSQD